jgi:hypothetical protein
MEQAPPFRHAPWIPLTMYRAGRISWNTPSYKYVPGKTMGALLDGRPQPSAKGVGE